MNDSTGEPDHSPQEIADCRLYVPRADGWSVHLQTPGQKSYCFSKHPGENHYHLILEGEIFLKNKEEVYCLWCSQRNGITTRNRLFWQKSGS